MLHSLHLSAVKADQTSGRVNFLKRIKVVDIHLRLCGVPLSKKLNCSVAIARRPLHRSGLRKYRTSFIHSVRKQYEVSLPHCGAESSELADRIAHVSSTLREGAVGGTNLESNGSVAVARPSDLFPSGGNCAFNYSNTVGILGGLSPIATLDFMRKIVDATDAKDESDHIPLILCSDPYMQKKILPSVVVGTTKASALSVSGSAPEMELSSVESLLEKRRFLEQAGAKCIVMPCHLSHLWYDRLAEGCSVPFLHMADCVIEELKAADFRPLEGGTKPKIGVLGTQATIAAEFYQEKLRSQGFDVAMPDKATMEHAVIPGIAALQRRDMEGARNLLGIAVQVLLVNAVNKVLLACHNTSAAFPADDPLLGKCVDPTDALARATVRWSRSMKGFRT